MVPCPSLTELELLLEHQVDACLDIFLPPLPFLCFLQRSRECCHQQRGVCSLSQGLGPPVMTLWPVVSLNFVSASPLRPPSQGTPLEPAQGSSPRLVKFPPPHP